MDNIWILAQAPGAESEGITSEPAGTEQTGTIAEFTDPTADPNAQRNAQGPGGFFRNPQLIFVGLMFVMLYFMIFRGPRKKQQKHKQMVQKLRKNDRVRTIGGIIGTIVDVKDDEIILKIDESNNTKIKIVPSAIGTAILKDKEDASVKSILKR